jgi:hypothetical protein
MRRLASKDTALKQTISVSVEIGVRREKTDKNIRAGEIVRVAKVRNKQTSGLMMMELLRCKGIP